jgi:hypothetical protein
LSQRNSSPSRLFGRHRGSVVVSLVSFASLAAFAAAIPACGGDDAETGSSGDSTSSDAATTTGQGGGATTGQGGGATTGQGGGATTGQGGASSSTTGSGGAGGGLGCTPGETMPCYSGPAGTDGVGPCAAGTQTCLPDGSAYDVCMGEVVPVAEICSNGMDEDCNGTDVTCAGGVVWAKSFGDAADQRAIAVALDPQGNVVVVGRFAGTVDLGAGPVTAKTPSDVFVAKVDPNGTLIFFKSFGVLGQHTPQDVAVDAAGNIFVTGRAQGTINFGGGDLPTNTSSVDAFVLKLDTNGAYVWAKLFGDSLDQSGTAIAMEGTNIFVAGRMNGTVDFGGGPVTSAGGRDVFVVRLSGDGAHLGTKRLGGISDEQPADLAVAANGDVVVSGNFTNAVDFGGGPLTSLGLNDAFLARYSLNGAFLWAKAFGDATDQIGTGVGIDSQGNVLALGQAAGTVDFGGGPLTSAGLEDLWVAKFTPAGAHVWSKMYGSPQDQAARFLSVDASDNLVFTGATVGPVDFGAGLVGGGGKNDVFYTKLDPAGALLFAYAAGDGADQFGANVVLDAASNGYLVGRFDGMLDFGAGNVLTGQGPDDAFIAKLAP